MGIANFQESVGRFDRVTFPEAPSYLAIIKLQEELGELAAHYIGRLQHRVGKPEEDHDAGIRDGVADVLIVLCVFCEREGINLENEVVKAWGEVCQRRWELTEGV